MRITISDGTDRIQDYEVLDDAKIAEFNKHKETLLDTLRNVYQRSPKSKQFDADKAWRSLTGFARSYVGHGSVKHETMPAADRSERLSDIAKILGKARRLINKTMQNEVGDDLFSGWWEEAGSNYAKADGSFDPLYMESEFKKAVNGLADLEAAASYAEDHVERPKRGKPPVLSSDDIWNLAGLYRESTGSVPGAGDGPFAKFVIKVLIAAGRPNDIEYESLTEAIKRARQWALTHPVVRKWAPSPFDEEA